MFKEHAIRKANTAEFAWLSLRVFPLLTLLKWVICCVTFVLGLSLIIVGTVLLSLLFVIRESAIGWMHIVTVSFMFLLGLLDGANDIETIPFVREYCRRRVLAWKIRKGYAPKDSK